MKSVEIAGLTLALIALPDAAMARHDSGPAPTRVMTTAAAPAPAMASRWATKRDGRWMGGWNAPGGWTAYRAPARGFMLPGYWVNPAFYIGNYGLYGFSTPQPGYGWSRYYDDAVLTDRDGRVYDTVRGVNWDRYDDHDVAYAEDYSDSYGYQGEAERAPPPRHNTRNKIASGVAGSIVGGVVGGVVGAVAGNLIAGHGDRLAGSLIGGGVGALAGAAVGEAVDRDGHHARGHAPRDDDRGYERGHHDDVAMDDHGPAQVYRDDGYYRHAPHWGHNHGWRNEGARVYHGGGYGYGYGAPEVTVVTVQSQPVTYTTTTTTEEVVYARTAVRKHYWKPRPHHVWKRRAQCVCGS